MERPQSIVAFERCYLGGWAIGLVNTILNWTTVQRDPNVALANEMVGAWYLTTLTAVGLLIPLILWYLIARRGSAAAKWVMVVLTALGVALLLLSGLAGRLQFGLRGLLSVAGVALNLYAATRLFRPDARGWFGEASSEIGA